MKYNVVISFFEQEADSSLQAAENVVKYIIKNPSSIYVEVDGVLLDPLLLDSNQE